MVIGAGATRYDGWLSTNTPALNALNPKHWSSFFPPGSIDKILVEHVIEHWTEEEFRSFLRIVRQFLALRGRIRIAVPDSFHPDPSYIACVKPGGCGAGSVDHKVLYDYIMMTRLVSEEQYGFNLLEYFDEGRQFHRLPWDASDGFVGRSADFDPRNKEHPLTYTSLILDIWPRREGHGL